MISIHPSSNTRRGLSGSSNSLAALPNNAIESALWSRVFGSQGCSPEVSAPCRARSPAHFHPYASRTGNSHERDEKGTREVPGTGSYANISTVYVMAFDQQYLTSSVPKKFFHLPSTFTCASHTDLPCIISCRRTLSSKEKASVLSGQLAL